MYISYVYIRKNGQQTNDDLIVFLLVKIIKKKKKGKEKVRANDREKMSHSFSSVGIAERFNSNQSKRIVRFTRGIRSESCALAGNKTDTVDCDHDTFVKCYDG